MISDKIPNPLVCFYANMVASVAPFSLFFVYPWGM